MKTSRWNRADEYSRHCPQLQHCLVLFKQGLFLSRNSIRLEGKKRINLSEIELITILPTLSTSYWEAVKNGLLISKSLLSRALYPPLPWSPGWNRITNLCPSTIKQKKHPGKLQALLCPAAVGECWDAETQHNVPTLSPHYRGGVIHS